MSEEEILKEWKIFCKADGRDQLAKWGKEQFLTHFLHTFESEEWYINLPKNERQAKMQAIKKTVMENPDSFI
jgi:hypothetical protein